MTFLALLELVKKGVASVLQSDTFSGIELTPRGAEATKILSEEERSSETSLREESQDLV